VRQLGDIPVDDLFRSLYRFGSAGLPDVDSPSRPIPTAREFPALRHVFAEFAALRPWT